MFGCTLTNPVVQTRWSAAGERAPRRLAALDRRLRGGQKGVAPQRQRRRAGVGRLADESQHVPFDAECPDDRPGGGVQ